MLFSAGYIPAQRLEACGAGCYAEKNTDFIDAYNAAWMMKHDVEKAFTFDRVHFNLCF